jgi:Fe-S-cluster containining protein
MRAEEMKAPSDPPWLDGLKALYGRIDTAVAAGIREAEAAGRCLACARGCAACCRTHTDIPVYPLELMGLYWFVLTQLPSVLRVRLAAQLAQWQRFPACPFLLDEACAIHPMRPMACRLFNVFDRPCGEGEDAFHTRPADVLPPPESAKREALDMMLAAQGVTQALRRELVASGAVHRLAQNLRALPWHNLAQRIQSSPCGEPGEKGET